MESNGIDMGAEIRRFVDDLEARNPELTATAHVQRAWRRSVDEQVLAHTDAVYVVPGTQASEVVVYVDAQIWATELNMQSELLRLRLNVELNEMLGSRVHAGRQDLDTALFELENVERVKKLRFSPSKEKYTGRFAQERAEDAALEAEQCRLDPVALDPDELAVLQGALEHIDDEHVRTAAFEAAKASMELAKARDREGLSSEAI